MERRGRLRLAKYPFWRSLGNNTVLDIFNALKYVSFDRCCSSDSCGFCGFFLFRTGNMSVCGRGARVPVYGTRFHQSACWWSPIVTKEPTEPKTMHHSAQEHPGRHTDLRVGDLLRRCHVRKFGAVRLEGPNGKLDCHTKKHKRRKGPHKTLCCRVAGGDHTKNRPKT